MATTKINLTTTTTKEDTTAVNLTVMAQLEIMVEASAMGLIKATGTITPLQYLKNGVRKRTRW